MAVIDGLRGNVASIYDIKNAFETAGHEAARRNRESALKCPKSKSYIHASLPNFLCNIEHSKSASFEYPTYLELLEANFLQV
jgi:hypothetical protein